MNVGSRRRRKRDWWRESQRPTHAAVCMNQACRRCVMIRMPSNIPTDVVRLSCTACTTTFEILRGELLPVV